MMLTLQIIQNVVNGLKRVEWMGEDYLVCPATMIVSGVLEGSQGPLYYPPDEMEASVNDWNGMPVVMYHPEVNGFHVSARNPDVMARHFIGWVFNTEYNAAEQRLVAEAWMKVNKLKEYDELLDEDAKVLPRLLSGKPVELSTGLYTQNTDGPGKDPKGTPYDNVARRFKPDHLAILPDRVGACPVGAGCGLGVNESKTETIPLLQETPMKEKLVNWLMANCSCWKNKAATLNNLSEDDLKNLKKQAIDGTLTKFLARNGKKAPALLLGNGRKLTKNAEGETEAAPGVSFPDLAEFFGITVDAASDPIGFVNALKAALNDALGKLEAEKPADEPTETPADAGVVMQKPDDNDDQPTGNKKGNKMTLADVLANDPVAKAQWDTMASQAKEAQTMKANQKKGLVSHIMGALNINEASKSAVEAAYGKMSVEDLVAIVQTLPNTQQQTANVNPLVGLPGMGGVVGGNVIQMPGGAPMYLGANGAGASQGGAPSAYGHINANEDDDVYPDPASHWHQSANGTTATK